MTFDNTHYFAHIAGSTCAIVEVDKQIELIKNELISQEEFEKIRNQFENQIVGSNASIAGICENLADNYVYYGNANRTNNQLDAYLKVTREDILRVAKKYLTQDARIILEYLPKPEAATDAPGKN